MIFTGDNLCIVLEALKDAKAELRNQQGTCPNVIEFSEQLEELDVWEAKYDRLIARVKKSLIKEGYDPKSLE